MDTADVDADPIGTLAYQHPRGPAWVVEVKTFAELRRRGADGHLARAQRLDFHLLLYARRGGGAYAVDFAVHRLRAGTVLMTQPGQVQWFDLDARAEGDAVLFTPAAVGVDAVVTALLDPLRWPVAGRVGRADRSAIDRALAALRDAAARPQDDTVGRSLVRHELCAIVIRFHGLLAAGTPPRAEVEPLFAAFAGAVEQCYARARDVGTYAQHLACSPRTLARCVHRARAQSPKEYIDQRVALEAKRALAHADEPVAAIAARLGFSEPTNFAKFFGRTSGTSPAAFRAALRRRG